MTLTRFALMTFKKFPLQVSVLSLMLLMAAFLEIIGLAALLPILMSLMSEGQNNPAIISIIGTLGINSLTLYEGMALITLIMALRGILLFTSMYVVARISASLEKELRDRLMHNFLNARWPYQRDSDGGIFQNALMRETGVSASAILQLGHLFTGIIIAACLMGTSIFMSPAAFIIFAISCAPYLYLSKKINLLMRQQSQKRLKAANTCTTHISDVLNQKKYIKATNSGEEALATFDRISQKLKDTMLATQAYKAIIFAYPEVLGIITVAVLVSIMYAYIEMPPEKMIFFLMLIYRSYGQVAKLQNARSSLVAYLPSYELVEKIIARSEQEKEISPPHSGKGEAAQNKEALAEFKNFSFSYGAGTPALKNINIQIPAKGLTAFVGKSGSGKTTLADALCGMLPVADGSLLISSTPISEINLSDLRHKISYVPQDIFLFSATVRDNILFGAEDKSEENLINAAQAAEIHDVITSLPEGYETLVGEGGQKLSGGQQQRIAIARAIARKPEILILDEATSALDNETENFIHNAIIKISHNLSVVVIAHRLSTVRQADQIYVLDEGKLAEQGTYTELMDKKGLFYKLQSFEKL